MMNIKPRWGESFFSPAYLAAWLIFGLNFVVAAMYFADLTWSRMLATVFYLVPSFLVIVFALFRKDEFKHSANYIDYLFVAFVLIILASLFFNGGLSVGDFGQRMGRYLPIMVAIPYLCGRMMRESDITLLGFISLLASFFLFFLMLPGFLEPIKVMSVEQSVRRAIFGYDHVALMVGVPLSVALISCCIIILGQRAGNDGRWRMLTLMGYAVAGLIVVLLVWIMARGWLYAGLTGVVVVTLFAKGRATIHRIGLLVFVFLVAATTLQALPRPAATFYKKTTTVCSLYLGEIRTDGPVLGQASCKSFGEGVDSVQMRCVLYQEAFALFMDRPFLGVGSSRFGQRSCVGYGTWPHSTILQAFSELGLLGGLTLICLLTSSLITLVSNAWKNESQGGLFVLGIMTAFVIADQIYGSYFMSMGTYLCVGSAAGIIVKRKRL